MLIFTKGEVLMIKKYFVPMLIVLFANTIVATSASPKTSATTKKASSTLKDQDSGCELIADFDDFMNQKKWPELIGSELPEKSMRMNINETPDSYHIEAELPGVKKEDIALVLKDNNLIISGEKKSFSEENKKQYLRIERSSGSFYRSIALPRNIDREKITSKLIDGVLKVDIMKAKNTQTAPEKKIDIL